MPLIDTMVASSLYLRQYPVLWRVYIYFNKHPCLYVLILFGLALFGLVVVRLFVDSRDSNGQYVVDYIADNVDVRLQMIDNFRMTGDGRVPMTITLSNTGNKDITSGKWRIYFNSLHGEVPKNLNCGLRLQHVIGGLYYLSSIQKVEGEILISAGKNIICKIQHKAYSISKTDHMTNWYVTIEKEDIQMKLLKSTTSEELPHVGTFDKPNLWKRVSRDTYNPYTPAVRFEMNSRFSEVSSFDESEVLPTPQTVKVLSSKQLKLDSNWVIQESDEFRNEVRYLAEKLNINVQKDRQVDRHVIKFLRTTDTHFEAERYTLKVDSTAEAIAIFADEPSGAFYGTQTLLSLIKADNTLPSVSISDKPRFPFRALMVDVTRNFRSKETIKKIIDAMATYKMNKLHLHLSDDEGWRLEIPGIPELTEVGSKRCHGDKNNICLVPSLGSGPFVTSSGSGYYTISDYKEILSHASKRHVQVIPEIDMPGHAMAAIFSMNFRESVKDRYGDAFTSYLLNDDTSSVESVQNWAGNSINPCLNSTYVFVNTLMDGLIQLHRGIQDLKILHIGGDEVPPGVWDNSQSCKTLFKDSSVIHSELKKLFVYSLAEIASQRGLNIGSWEDGLYQRGVGPYQRSGLKTKEVYVNPWHNKWEEGSAGRAHEFADEGYKVILSFGTVLYFDHPYEPDPEERGLYWASRYTNTESVFGFMPDDIFANDMESSFGAPISREEACGHQPCPTIKKPENIVGIQSCLWGELIRTDEQFYEMLFPRLLAVAERSWHKASWEDIKSVTSRNVEKMRDFRSFVNQLGRKELPRLEKLGISYRLPIPGATLADGKVNVNVMYPNHKILYSVGGKDNWQEVENGQIDLSKDAHSLYVKSMSRITGKSSRSILVFGTNGAGSVHDRSFIITLAVMLIVTCIPVIWDRINGMLQT